jgi:copper chaperone CopZ
MMTTTRKTFQVTGQNKMNCGGCESSVKFALSNLPGVQAVEASHKTQRIELTCEPDVADLTQIRQELDWLGYQVAEVEAG